MRTRYDQLCKQMVRTGLDTCGPIETDAEVAADTRRIDLWFVRDPKRGPIPDRGGLQAGLRGQLKLGFEEGFKQGFALSVVEVYQARFGAMPEDLRAVVEDTGDKPTLITWLRLASTRSADEIAAVIRSFHPS